jgi:hypothetical protein
MNGESKRREFRSYDPKNARTKDDDEDEKDLGRGESRREVLCVETIDQAGQHRYDTREHLLARKNTIGGNQSFTDHRIEASGALKCRAAGVIKKLGALATLAFTVPFGRIEKHRKTRAVKLVDQLASSWLDDCEASSKKAAIQAMNPSSTQ